MQFKSWWACGLLLVLAGGCVTGDPSRTQAHAREDMLIMRESVTRLEGRMEALELEYRRLLNDLEMLRSGMGEDGVRHRSVQDRLATMEQRLQALDAARERDRQAVIDQLSGHIAQVIKQTAGARGGAAAGGTGYEHVVQAGETLSAIAAAYQVSMRAIIEANDLQNPDRLRQGQKLFIPR